jgi:uncharacterized protein
MEKNYKLIGKSIFFPQEKLLAIADLHMGYEEALNKQGIMVPRRQYKETVENLKILFEEVGKVKEIVICGDLKHEFGSISQQEWQETLMLIDFLLENSEKVILVRGNHDKILGPIAEKRNIEVRDYYVKDGICFVHGDIKIPEILDKKIETIVIGHRHPAIVISDKYKEEKYKCFLVGKWKKKNVIILPSFFPMVEGGDVIGEEDNSLFIPDRDLRKFEVFIVSEGNEVLDFGKMRDIGSLE